MYPRNRFIGILFVLLIVLGIGTYFWTTKLGVTETERVIEEAKYDSVLVELRMIAKYVEYSGDSLNGLALTAEVWKRYGIDQASFLKAQQFYETDAKGQGSRLGQLADSLSALELRINKPE